MEVLIALSIATVLVLGWTRGNLFTCVFLTLGTLVLTIMLSRDAGPWAIVGGGIVLLLTWAPRMVQRNVRPGWFMRYF